MNTRLYPYTCLLFALCISAFAQTPQNAVIKHDDTGILNFSEFEPKFEDSITSSPDKQQWYRIDFGNGYFEAEPPGKAFVLNELPSVMKESTQIINIRTLSVKKHRYSDNFIVSHDPLGRKLKEPFSLGKVMYFLIQSDTESGIQLSYYYYDSGDVKWENQNTPEPSKYKLDSLEILQNRATFQADKWLLEVTGEKTEEYLVEGKREKRKLYRYSFIKVRRL
jgi:hypothetical protein